MSLTETQKTIVQTTFAQVKDADALAARFYQRLFESAPQTRSLFKSDLRAQGQKLVQTIAVVVYGLDDLPQIVPAIENLGKRHAHYGVRADDWDTVGAALLWTLEDTFGDAFTDEVRDAWATAYGVIAGAAVQAADVELQRISSGAIL